MHPLAIEELTRLRTPTHGLHSKGWEEFAKAGAPVMDFVFTVCDKAAGEECPVWPGSAHHRPLGNAGSCRSGRALRTTMPDPAAACPSDKVQRFFYAERPNQLWASDFTYVSTWQGFVTSPS